MAHIPRKQKRLIDIVVNNYAYCTPKLLFEVSIRLINIYGEQIKVDIYISYLPKYVLTYNRVCFLKV